MEGTNTLFSSYKIPLGKRKCFFEIYRQFGHASSKRFASSGLRFWDGRPRNTDSLLGTVKKLCSKALTVLMPADRLTHWVMGAVTKAAWEWSSVLRIRVFGAVPPLPITPS